MRSNRLLMTAGLAAVLVSAAACSSSTQSSSGSTAAPSGTAATPTQAFKINSILALSGPIAAIGQGMEQGEKAALSVVNSEGGVFGKPVQLQVTDDAGDPTQAVAKVQALISQGGLQAVQPGTISAEVDATVPLLTKGNVFSAGHGIDPVLNNPAKYPYAFSTGYLPQDPANSLAAEFAAQGYKKVGLVTDTTSGGLAQEAADKVAFSAKGISLVAANVPAGAVDATSQFEQVLAAKPDVLLLDAYGAAAGPIVKARAELDPKVPTYGGQLLAANNLGSIAPASDYTGMKLQSIAVAVKDSAATQTPAFQKFYAALIKETGGSLPFTMNTYVVAYDDIIVMTTAAKLADSTNAAKMAAAMNHITPTQMPDFVGPVNYSTTDHFPTFGPPYWIFVSYGPLVNGQLVPASS